MRLGQLARKYDVSIQDIISYLNEIEPTHNALHPNAKLSEHTETLVAKHFEPILEVTSEPEEPSEETPEEIVEIPLEPEVVEIEEEVEVPPIELDSPLPEPEEQNSQKKEDETIETDRLLELLESEEVPVDLSKITLIKAPKKELDGLKVVGKIDLPEPKIKTEEESNDKEREPKPLRNGGHQRTQLSEEELERRRKRAKKKKEEYEARQERRIKEKEEKQRKAKREAHYKQKLQRIKPRQNVKKKPQRQQASLEVEEQRPKPKTLLGRFLRWLNT